MTTVWTIYKHTCLDTGKPYVGQTVNTMQQRWVRHVSEAKHGDNTRFHEAIRTYGVDRWAHEVLETCDSQLAANAAERKWILAFKSNGDDGYNQKRPSRLSEHARRTLAAMIQSDGREATAKRFGIKLPTLAKAADGKRIHQLLCWLMHEELARCAVT